MRLKLTETFVSIQGEGHLAGKKMFFIRFAGCNVRSCPLHPINSHLCDTDWSLKRALEGTDEIEALAAQASTLMGPQGWVSITGGEPTDQMEALNFLVGALRERGLQVNIQTSGVRLLPCPWDWLTVSPKCLRADLQQAFGNELKLVYMGQSPEELADWRQNTKFWNYYLMPLDAQGDINTTETVEAVMQSGWELTTQAHKVWGVQ